MDLIYGAQVRGVFTRRGRRCPPTPYRASRNILVDTTHLPQL